MKNITSLKIELINFQRKNRLLLKLMLDIYFLPYNLLKLIKYLRMRHEYKKNQIEIEVLSKKIKNFQSWRSNENK